MDDIFIANITQQPLFYAHFSFSRLIAQQSPFLLDIMGGLAHFFGLEGSGLRFFGVFCFLLNLILIFQLSKTIFEDNNIGILACLIFTLHPMAIQGSMLLDIDNTTLTLILMLTCLYYVKNIDNFKLKNGIFLSLLFFIGLWAKLSTPFILMGSLMLFHFLRKEKIKAFQIFIIGMIAALIYLLMRRIDLHGFPQYFPYIFRHAFGIIERGPQGTSLAAGKELALRFSRVSLWLGLYTLLFWIVIISRRAKDIIVKKEQLNLSDFLLIYSVCIFVPYILFHGTLLGFPKYQYPILPILSIIIANAVVSLDLNIFKKNIIIYLCFGAAFAIISYIFSGDLLYQINYTLKKIAIFSPQALPGFYKDFAKRIMFYFTPFVIGILVLRIINKKEKLIALFSFLSIVFILVNNIAVDLRMRNSNHYTTFYYGRDIAEFKNVAALCRTILEKDKDAIIIGPSDLLKHAGFDIFVGYHRLWNKPDKFLKIMKNRKVKAIIYNFIYNAFFTYKEIFLNPLVQAELKENYKLIQLEEHSVWLRKR